MTNQLSAGTNCFTQALEALWRWHLLEKSLDSGGIVVVDFNLLPPESTPKHPFSSRAEALTAITAAADEIEQHRGEQQQEFWKPAQQKLRACQSVLRHLLGERLPFFTLLAQTIGITYEPVPEVELEFLTQQLCRLLAQSGFPADPSATVAYFESAQIADGSAVSSRFRALADVLVPRTAQWLERPAEIPYRVQMTDVDAYWANWLTTDDENGILLKFNLHPSIVWTRGRIERLVVHEIGAHAVQLLAWKEEISAGRMHPLCGFVTTFSSELLSLEALAEALPSLAPPDLLTLDGKIHDTLGALRWYTFNNALGRLLAGATIDEAVSYSLRHLPWNKESATRQELETALTDPLLGCYKLAYGYGRWKIASWSKNASAEARQRFAQQMMVSVQIPAAG